MRWLLLALVGCLAGCSLLFESAPAPPCDSEDVGVFEDVSGARSRYVVHKCEQGGYPTQAEAGLVCQALGGTLVNIESVEEQDYLFASVGTSKDYWMGLSYEVGTGFRWDGSSSPVEIFCDASGCSGVLPDEAENTCYLIDMELGGLWRPKDCERTDDYICEIKE